MKRAILILALAAMAVCAIAAPASSPAKAPKWQVVSTVRDEAGAPIEVWSIRDGSIGRDGDTLFAIIEVAKPTDAPQTSPIYRVAVNASHCNRLRGDIAVNGLDGQTITTGVYIKGSMTVAANLAATLCRKAAQ